MVNKMTYIKKGERVHSVKSDGMQGNSVRLAMAAAQNIKEREYWLRQLSGEPEKTVLPPDFKSEPPSSVVDAGTGGIDFR